MDCLPVSKLPEGPEWSYELKLDGYRLEAVRGTKEVTLYSRRRNVLNDLLQKYRSAESHIIYYVFDILVLENRDLTRLPLSERRRILSTVINPKQHVALSVVSNRSAAEMLKFAKKHGLEGAGCETL